MGHKDTAQPSAKPSTPHDVIDVLAHGLPLPAAWRTSLPPHTNPLVLVTQSLALDFLLQAGGGLHRRVPHHEHEQVARQTLWEACPPESLALGPRVSALLEALQASLQHPDDACRLVEPLPDNGEMFLYHALYRHLQHNQRARRWLSALRKVSPLTRLVTFPVVSHHERLTFADGQTGQPSVSREELEAWFDHPAQLFVQGHLADQWADIPAPKPLKGYESQLERLNVRRATLALYLEVCRSREAIPALGVFPLFFARLLRQNVVNKALEVQQCRAWKLSVREQMLSAYLGLLQLSDTVEQIVQEQIVEPGAFGWSRPLEVKAFQQEMGRLWSGSLRQDVEQARQQLRAQMG